MCETLLHRFEMYSMLILVLLLWCGIYFSFLRNYCSTTHIVGCNFLVVLILMTNMCYLVALSASFCSAFCQRNQNEVARAIRYISRCTACCCTNSGENVPVVGARDSTSTSDLDTNSAGIEMIVESLNPCVGFEEEKNEIDDFEFNQDLEINDQDNFRSPGWIRYQKKIK